MSNKLIYKKIQDKFSLNPELGNITLNTSEGSIVIKGRDTIGNSIQNWLGFWLSENGFIFTTPENTQEFPDYIINPDTPIQENLEIKSWYAKRSPAFDIANFESYVATLQQDPTKIDADYLIFKYDMDIYGDITIQNVFLKKIWEITGPSAKYQLKVQEKRGVIYNIRPITWESKSPKFGPFNNRNDFVRALSDTLIKYKSFNPDALEVAKLWYPTISNGYFNATGNNL